MLSGDVILHSTLHSASKDQEVAHGLGKPDREHAAFQSKLLHGDGASMHGDHAMPCSVVV